MQVTVKEQNGLSHSFNIVVSAADVETQVQAQLQAVGQKVKMQGFRPGKVPMTLLKQRYGKEVMGDVLEASINKATRELLEEKNLRPAMQPDIAVVAFEEGSDLSFDINFDVLPTMPEIDFSKLTVADYTYEIPEKELSENLERLAKSRAHTHVVEKAAAIGNSVKIDFVGKIDGEPFDGGTASGFMLELGSNQFIEGFEQQLVGTKTGDVREVSVKFPENYHNANLSGTPAVFTVTVHEVHEAHLPEIDDAFAATLGFKDLENLKGAIRQQIDFEYKNRVRTKAKKQLFDALDTAVKMEVPAKMLAFENETIMKQVLDAKQKGDAELKDKSEEELKKEYGVIAERRVRLGILLSEVARTNNLQITREEISAAVMSQARNYPGQEDKIFEFYRKNPREVEELRGPILEEKAVDFILGKVTRKATPITIEELMKDEDE